MPDDQTESDRLFGAIDPKDIEPKTLQLAVNDSEGTIPQEELSNLLPTGEELSFSLVERGNGDDERHHVRISDNELKHEIWTRYRYNQKEESGPSLQIAVEIRRGTLPEGTFLQDVTVDGNALVSTIEHSNVQLLSTDRVAGLDQQKDQLRRFLRAENSDWGLSNRTGMLLKGPPGTGKTELVIETCEELFGGMPVIISGPEILNKWVGESERLLRKKFQEAKDSTSQILYIDEIDAIARSRNESTHEHSAQLVAQLLVLLDGVNAKTNDAPKVIASTNLPKVLDPALLRPGRLGNQPITFSQPGRAERKAIFHHYLKRIRTSDEGQLHETLHEAVTDPIESNFLNCIASKTEGYTGADIEDTVISAVTQLQVDGSKKQADSLDASAVESIVENREHPNKMRKQG